MKHHGPRYHVKPRRQRQGRTDYRKRLRLLKSRETRIVVRKSLKQTRVQFVGYHLHGDEILVSASSLELSTKYHWKHPVSNTPAAYLTGVLAGKRAQEQGISQGILDVGRAFPTTGSKLFAALKGVVDAGITCPYDEAKIPSEDRLMGKHMGNDLSSQVTKIKQQILEA